VFIILGMESTDTNDLMKILELQRYLFTNNLHFIVQNLNASDIVDQLISEHMVGQSAREQLKLPVKTNMDKNNIIVDELSRGQPGTLEKFLYILRNTSGSTNFKFIADKLEKGTNITCTFINDKCIT